MFSWITYPSIFTQPPKRSFNFFTLPRFPISWRVSKGNSKLKDCPMGIEPFTFSQTVSTWRGKKVGLDLYLNHRRISTFYSESQICYNPGISIPSCLEIFMYLPFIWLKKMIPDFLKLNLRQVTRMHSISLTYAYIHYRYTIIHMSKTTFKKRNYHPLAVPTRVNGWNLRRRALELHAIFAFLFVLEAAIVSRLERCEETKDIGHRTIHAIDDSFMYHEFVGGVFWIWVC